jgi:gag-polypeptide of LTR copia-type
MRGLHTNAAHTHNANKNKIPIFRRTKKKQRNETQPMLQEIIALATFALIIQIYRKSKASIRTMSDFIDDRKLSEIITLAKLHHSDYRIWVSQAEATFTVYDCLNIVQGMEPNPALTQAPGAAITPANRKLITSWATRHALAREALLRCLDRSELIKVHNLPLASEIWTRLNEEYGAISDALYAKAETQFHSLRKLPTTSVQAHVDNFTKLLADTQYHAPPSTPKMTDAQVNLAFLRSLGPNYETFQQAMGDQTYRLKPGELYARVKALAESKDEPLQRQIAASDESTRALAFRISNRRGPPKGSQGRFRNLRFKGRFIRPDNGGYRGYGRISNGNISNYDGNKTCHFCKRIGHVLKECHKLKWRNQQNSRATNGDTDYRPGCPTFRANITFIANNAT